MVSGLGLIHLLFIFLEEWGKAKPKGGKTEEKFKPHMEKEDDNDNDKSMDKEEYIIEGVEGTPFENSLLSQILYPSI